jgi:hypothetical protein
VNTLSITANTESTLATGYYDISTWRDGAEAYQGAAGTIVSSTTGRKSRVGVILFPDAGTTLKNKSIKSITLKLTAANAGYGSDTSKTLTICKSNYQKIDKSIASKDYVGDILGTITGIFYGNTKEYTLNSSNNNTLFNALKAYMESGNSCLVIYNGEHVGSTASYSKNYLSLTKVILTVEYEDNYIYYNNNGTATKCAVYYNNNGIAVRCAVYYNNNGAAVKV